jgi:hypothetical protein
MSDKRFMLIHGGEKGGQKLDAIVNVADAISITRAGESVVFTYAGNTQVTVNDNTGKVWEGVLLYCDILSKEEIQRRKILSMGTQRIPQE